MGFSFLANFRVFQPEIINASEQVLKFIVVTAFSLYIIQNIIIYVTSNLWLQPVQTVLALSRKHALSSSWNDDFISKNTVKFLATACSLVWNFLWYKYYVYI